MPTEPISTDKQEILDKIDIELDQELRAEMALEFLQPDRKFTMDEQDDKEKTERRNRRQVALSWIGRHCLNWICREPPYLYKQHGRKNIPKLNNIDISRERFIKALPNFVPLCRYHWENSTENGGWNTMMGIARLQFHDVYEWITAPGRLRYDIPDSDTQLRIAEFRDGAYKRPLQWIPTPEWPHDFHKNPIPKPYPGHPAIKEKPRWPNEGWDDPNWRP